MLKSNNHEYMCTQKCSLKTHGNSVTAALTKRSLADDKLAAFIAKTCCNFPNVLDDLGRSAVHLAASVDRYTILEWLINHGAKIHVGDYESCSTPLHRALFYGCIDCAVLLLRYGASLSTQDADTYCPLQNICRLMDFKQHKNRNVDNEILVWGSNKNYNLGIGIEEGPNTPQSISFFRKSQICITQVAMGSFHSLFLDSKGNLYAAGHGKGGRLGINNENSLPIPKKVKVPMKNTGEYITCISVSNKHSLVLTNHSTVFACGLNEDQQLGVRGAPEKLSVFKEVVSLRDFGVENLIQVIARDYYSIAHSNAEIYCWGRNLGQFGIDTNTQFISAPTLIRNARIKFVDCNNAALLILTDANTILLYNNGKLRTINPPNYHVLKAGYVQGGDSIKNGKGTPSALKLLLVEETNNLTFWYEKTKLFYSCDFTQIRLTQIDKLIYKGNQMLILSRGNMYQGKCQQVSVPSYYNEADAKSSWSSFNSPQMLDFCKMHMMRVELQRLPNVDRVLNIFANEDFNSFATLQEGPYKYFKAPNSSKVPYNFKKLYLEAHEDDAVHDVIFHVDGEIYPAHKLIIFSRAPGLRDVVRNSLDKHVHLNFNQLTGKIFELILKFVYINYLPVTDDLIDIDQSLGPAKNKNVEEKCQLLLNFAEQFHLNDLANYLKSNLKVLDSEYILSTVPEIKTRFVRLRRTDFPELYDVNIICAGDTEISAHKCILVARLEYFEMMFTHTWAEQSVINLTTIPIEYLQPMIDFIYSSDEESFRRQNYTETFLYNLIVLCDQFLYAHLRKVCERLLVDKITIRKCGDMLDFACIYNCELLRRSVIRFICQNLARVLTYKTLENCEAESLNYINTEYRAMFKNVFDYRVITPDSDAIDDDLLLSFVDDFTVDLDYRAPESEMNSSGNSSKIKTSLRNSSTRQHERDAISTMMRTLSVNENEKLQKSVDENKTVKEAQSIGERWQDADKHWMRVVDKKNQKKKLWRDVGLNINKILKEEKPVIELVPLSIKPEKPDTPNTATDMDKLTECNNTFANRSLNLADMSDFTPSREKLSQKQRKLLLNMSTSSTVNSTSLFSDNASVSSMASSPPNAWGIVPTSNDWSNLAITVTGTAADSESFANVLRDKTSTPSKASSSKNKNEDFMQIQAEERKQRDHYERLRNKSLRLTQIEETAITELRAFYNVDNVTDEIITIERKQIPQTMNFALWQRN